jgi:CheY-like chemotaxis protein
MSTAETEVGIFSKTRPTADLPRVLLVEDEQPIRDFLIPLLFGDGFDCREAANGRAAMDLLATGTRINLVLSNMLLPVIDGLSLLLHVKQRYPRIPFAFVSAVNDAEIREEAMRQGADGYLLKPFSGEEFLEFVRRVMSTSSRPGRGSR